MDPRELTAPASVWTPDERRVARRLIIDLARRRQHPGTGSGRAFLDERTSYLAWPDLSAILTPLLWAVVGAVALRMYMPERATHDLDIVVLEVDGRQAREKLKIAGLSYTGELSIGGSTWRTGAGVVIDVLEGRDAWWPEALAHAQANRDRHGLPIIGLSYLVLMKFLAGRSRDLGDLTQALGLADDNALNGVRALFRQHGGPDDMDDLESLIVLGKLEMGEGTRHGQ